MNRLFLLLFGAVPFVAHAQVPDYVPTEGLVGWWPLDGNAEDAHQNMNGVVYGASEGIGPNDSPCLNFDGVDDYVEVPTNPTLESIEDELTISCWFLKSNSTNSMLVVKRNFIGNPNGERHHFEFAQVTQISHDRAFHFSSYDNSDLANHNCQVWTDDDAFDYDVWTHASVTFSNGLVKFFVDGFQIHEHDCGFQQLPPNNHWLNFARMHRSGGVPFSGELEGGMQNVGIWNRALTEEEIFALYNAEPPIPGCTDPTACNYDAEATSDDGSCIPSGCMEPLACNYNAMAECPGDACDYTCCPGPGCCGPGMHWDYNAAQCAIDETCEDDLDGDGVIGVNDLMQLLSSFGTDCTPAVEVNETPVVEDALYVLDHSIFNQPEAFTIAARTAFNGPEATAIVYHQVDGGEMKLSHTNGVLNFQVKASYGNCFTASGWVYAQTELADNNHHHIVATYSRTSGEITLSIDGEVQAIQPVNDGDLADCNIYEASIGSESVQNWNLAEIGFYEFAWSEDQIANYSGCTELANLGFDSPAVLLPVGTSSEEAAQILNSYNPMQIQGSTGVISCD